MFVVEVIPLMRGAAVSALSYYSPCQYAVGSLIKVPVRKRIVTALVTKTTTVTASKTNLRQAGFALRKLPEQGEVGQLPKIIYQTGQALADNYPAQLGSILQALMPPDIRNGHRAYPQSEAINSPPKESPDAPTVLSDLTENRFLTYRSLIRGTLAQKQSVLFVIPTTADLDPTIKRLQPGLEKRLAGFGVGYTKAQLDSSYRVLSDSSEAKLIVATPNYAFLPRADLGLVIIEQSGSDYYEMRNRPLLDWRTAFLVYARLSKAALFFGDTVLRPEEEESRRNDKYQTYDEPIKRFNYSTPLSILVRPRPRDPQVHFPILTPPATEQIERATARGGRVFLYAAHRGLAPAVICYDCGYLFRCPESKTPYSLLRRQINGQEKRWFVSGTSGRRIPAADVCPECGSWRLREQGIGIQQLELEMKNKFVGIPIFTIDRGAAANHRQARRIADSFYDTKGSVLLGTALALPFLTKPLDTAIVTSYEATRALPTWRADEIVLARLLYLRERCEYNCSVQTRFEPDDLLRYAEGGFIEQFQTDQINIREQLNYPPFAYLILITAVGNKETSNRHLNEVVRTLKGYPFQTYKNPYSTPEKTIRHALLRVSREAWPDPTLMDKLRQLPPGLMVAVNPRQIV